MIAIVYKILFFLFESKLQFLNTDENCFWNNSKFKTFDSYIAGERISNFMYFFFCNSDPNVQRLCAEENMNSKCIFVNHHQSSSFIYLLYFIHFLYIVVQFINPFLILQ